MTVNLYFSLAWLSDMQRPGKTLFLSVPKSTSKIYHTSLFLNLVLTNNIKNGM